MRISSLGVCLAVLVGCNVVADPGNRARDFVEDLVESESAAPPDLADGLAAHIALDYLRALHRQGTALDYSVADTKRRGAKKTVVRLHVASAAGATAGAASDSAARLGVELDRDADGAWRVVRWWADD